VPAFGQVQGDIAAAVAGGPGGDVDELAAQHRSDRAEDAEILILRHQIAVLERPGQDPMPLSLS
jgi:hypothetical protein